MAVEVTEERAHGLLREIYRTDFRAFVKKVFATVSPGVELKWNWHLDVMCDYLEAARRGDIKRLIINVPPRSLKSIICSIAWPAWILGHNAAAQIIGASYGETLAIKLSVDTRLVIESDWYKDLFPGTMLSPDQNEKWKYQTTKRGHRISASVGGKITGEGAQYILLDDPIKPDEALSEAGRRNVNNWIRQTLMSRFNDQNTGIFVLIMQRVHEDDPSGNFISDGGWTHVSLPGEFLVDTVIPNPLGKADWVIKAGTLLDPVRGNKMVLDQQLKDMGESAYAGQIMQNPAPAEGGMVKWHWFKFYEDRPFGFDAIIQAWDTAIKVETEHDWSVGMVWGIRWDGYYLLDLVRKKVKYPELKTEVKKLYERDLPRYILVEDKASGQQLLQDYGAQRGVPMLGLMPDGNKIVRLNVVTDVIYSGKVYLPAHAPWLESFKEELRVFPNGKHDDQVDCLSMFLGWAKLNFDKLAENGNVFEENKDPLADLYEDRDVHTGRSLISGY